MSRPGQLGTRVEYVSKGDHWVCVVDGSVQRCVSCNQAIEYAAPRWGRANHHCSDKHEAAKQAANTRLSEPIVRKQTISARLKLADELRRMSGDDP